MARPQPPFQGACLCGSVQVVVTAPPMLTLACHCRDCQKLCASAFSLTTMFPKDSFSYSGAMTRGGHGLDGRAHYFCKKCMNFIYSQIGEATQRINLRTSILDNAEVFEPFVELMTDEKMPWAAPLAAHSFKRFPTTPEELQSLIDAYSRQ